MIPLKRVLKDYRESGALSALVSVHAALDERTFLTKGGDLLMVLQVEGEDDECLDATQLDQTTRRLESSIRVFDPHFRVYQYWMKRNNATIPARTYDNPVVEEAVTDRLAYLQAKADQLYSVEIYFVVAYEGWKPSKGLRDRISDFLHAPVRALHETLSPRLKITALQTELDHARETLANRVMSFIVQLPESLHARALRKEQAFHFLRALLNYAPYKAETVALKDDRYVDFQACDSTLECHPDHLRLDDFYLQALTLKDAPGKTFANLLRGLQEITCGVIVVSEWKREEGATMRSKIHSKRRHFHNVKSSMMNYLASSGEGAPKDMLVDDSAAALVADLGAALQEMELNGHAFGQFSMTIILYNEDRARVRRGVAECFKVFATHDGLLTEERYNLLNSWLAVLPGNHAYNLRRMYLLDTNYADLSFLYRPKTGEKENTHLRSEYLAVLETEHHTPYFLNLHYQDVAHTAIFGATGSGKSFLLNFLLTHVQKYGPLTYVFDLGGSYDNLTRLFDGAYLPVGIEKRPFTINPFALVPTAENLHFLFSFSKVLMESDSFRLSAQEERDLYEQIENLYVIEPDQRRLLTLTNMLGRNLRLHLQKWVEGGPYAALFDNAEDNLTFARFQTFDFEGMDKVPQVLEALLFYVLHRANAAIHDPDHTTVFKVFVIDEAWRFFRHPTIKLYILEALKTWRKKNAAMILATQSSDDLFRSEMLPVVVENCSTKMFLANPNMDPKTYRDIFHLNETEADRIARLIPKQQILVKRPDLAKVLDLRVTAKDYWLYTSSPYDRERRRQVFDRHGFKQGLEILRKETSS